MTHHDLKCDPVPFTEVFEGRKRAEFRKNDRFFEIGDTLTLWEWLRHPGRKSYQYSGHFVNATVTHVERGGAYGIRVGYAMLSLNVDGCGVSSLPGGAA